MSHRPLSRLLDHAFTRHADFTLSFHSLTLIQVQVYELCRKWKIDCSTINISTRKLRVFLLTFIFFYKLYDPTILDYISSVSVYFCQRDIFNYPLNSTSTRNMETYFMNFFPIYLFIYFPTVSKICRWFMYYVISQRNWFFTSIHNRIKSGKVCSDF